MSICLRLLLIMASVVAVLYVIRKIRKSQMKIEDAMYWVALSFFTVILGVFPEIIIVSAKLIGVESPVNLLYLFMLFLALWKIFSLSVKNSQLENRLNSLTEEIAIWEKKVEDSHHIE